MVRHCISDVYWIITFEISQQDLDQYAENNNLCLQKNFCYLTEETFQNDGKP